MLHKLKIITRKIIPQKYQVPIKYWYGFAQGKLEKEMSLLKFLVHPGDKIIDIGGNRGIYAYKLWKLGAKCEVFEPNPICLNVLTAWALNKPDMVTVHAVALSSNDGTAHLHIPIDEIGVEHDASASIEELGFKNSRDQLVSLQTLDSFQFQNVSLIKIDVEGHEYNVIEGAAETLISSYPALLIEIEQRHNDRLIIKMFDKILDFGYQGFFLMNNKLIALEKFDISTHQSMDNFGSSKKLYINNFLFLHQDKIKRGEYKDLMDKRYFS